MKDGQEYEDEAELEQSRLTDEKCTTRGGRAICFVATAIVSVVLTVVIFTLSANADEDYGAFGPIQTVLIVAVIICNLVFGICWLLDTSWMQGRRFVNPRRSDKDEYGGTLASDIRSGSAKDETPKSGSQARP